MGLTGASVGRRAAADTGFVKKEAGDRLIALAGNPNVGKSTVFNALTGMNQHTGNWPGKTVAVAAGRCRHGENQYLLVDIPGAYSLAAHSPEEEVARDFLCHGGADATVVVCDATCLFRNLNLVLQILELTPRVVVCVNLMDEAKRRGITPDLTLLEERLGVPVVGCTARKKKTLTALLAALDRVMDSPPRRARQVTYPAPVEQGIDALLPLIPPTALSTRFCALRLLCGEGEALGTWATEDEIRAAVSAARRAAGLSEEACRDTVASATMSFAVTLGRDAVGGGAGDYHARDRRLDRFLTGRRTAYPVMLLLLALVFFITVVGANYPSAWLSSALSVLSSWLSLGLAAIGTPIWLHSLLIDGVIGVLFRVISVMLPPMAIFFPLFTLLEDSGYLPRIAYNLDRPFRACSACGKQALTMCMGFGCNAAGVVGCRIIDSPRERLLAILTNSLVPCNGRFPALLSLIMMFFIGAAGGVSASLLSAVLLTLFILLSIGVTFLATRLLSATVLRGQPSSFTLELPPFRRPQIGRVIVRSLLDRTIYVLGRAAAVAAPAGLIIWLAANLTVGGETLLAHAAAFLDPFGRFLGMDGIILFAFVLGFPANEIVLPLAVMAYTAQGSPVELESVSAMRELFVANGWTPLTALCTAVFFLFHWPCSTTLLTVQKETGKWRYTALAALLPTVIGMALCALIAAVGRLFL